MFQDNIGSLIHYAIGAGLKPRVFELLLEHGADPNVANDVNFVYVSGRMIMDRHMDSYTCW